MLTLWSASKGMLSLLYGLDAVLEVRETRRYLHRRLLCVLYTVGMLLALLLTLGLYVGGQALLAFLLARGFSFAAVLEPILRNLHLYSFVLLTALFTGVFLALPDKRQRFVHVLPGAAGASEGSFYLFFSMFFTGGTIKSAILLWRIFSYYAVILVSAPFCGITKKMQERGNKQRRLP